jgi:DNA-binding GntR family transcriptional regulator
MSWGTRPPAIVSRDGDSAGEGAGSEGMKIERPKSLTGLVVDELRARIIDGRLRLGEGLSENVLAADLGISKTPVREALLQLKLERMVDVLPQRGTYVFRLARDEVVKISELREMLELPAAAVAIERSYPELVARLTEIYQEMSKAYKAGDNAGYRARDGELHQTIIDLCANPYLSNAYNQVAFRIQALRSRLADEMSLNRVSYKDHGEMLKLVKARKVEELQALLRAHIRQTMHSYLEVLGDRDALGEVAAPEGSDAGAARKVRRRKARTDSAPPSSMRASLRNR